MRLRIRRSQLMWKSSCLNVRVGERDDKSVMHRQRQGMLPRYDHHVCSDSGCWKVVERSSHKARMTKLIMSDETLEERVIAFGKKRNLHPVFYQGDVPD